MCNPSLEFEMNDVKYQLFKTKIVFTKFLTHINNCHKNSLENSYSGWNNCITEILQWAMLLSRISSFLSFWIWLFCYEFRKKDVTTLLEKMRNLFINFDRDNKSFQKFPQKRTISLCDYHVMKTVHRQFLDKSETFQFGLNHQK